MPSIWTGGAPNSLWWGGEPVVRLLGSLTKSHRVPVARQRAWNAIRIFKVFRASEIAAGADINEANLQKYLLALQRANYLRVERPKQNGKSLGHIVWRLVDNTGPHCPIVRQEGVYDPNQDQVRFYSRESVGDGNADDDKGNEGSTDDERADDDGRELDHRVA